MLKHHLKQNGGQKSSAVCVLTGLITVNTSDELKKRQPFRSVLLQTKQSSLLAFSYLLELNEFSKGNVNQILGSKISLFYKYF